MAVKNMNAAPAPNTPFLNVSHEGGIADKYVLYLVWYAFLTEPANKHTSAMKNATLHQEQGI